MKKNRINNFKYLVITISVLSLFTACCKEDDIIEDPKPEPQAKTGTKTETVQKTIPQPGISLSGTWNVDHPTYQVNISNFNKKNQYKVYIKETFTDAHTIPETVKERKIKLTPKDSVLISDERYWPSKGEEIFKACAFLETDTATLQSDTVTLVHPSEWITTRRVGIMTSAFNKGFLYVLDKGSLYEYSCETGNLTRSYKQIFPDPHLRSAFFDGDDLYIVLGEADKLLCNLYKLNLKTSNVKLLATFTSSINRVWVDKSKVYFCDLHTQVLEVKLNSKEANPIKYVNSIGAFNYFAKDGNYIYGSNGTELYRYKSGDPSSVETIGNLPSSSWQRLNVIDGWLYYVENNIMCKTPINSINNPKREIIKFGCPFEPKFEYGNSVETYTDGKNYYVRLKFNGMSVAKKRAVNYKK
jgi:hypothetical protein